MSITPVSLSEQLFLITLDLLSTYQGLRIAEPSTNAATESDAISFAIGLCPDEQQRMTLLHNLSVRATGEKL